MKKLILSLALVSASTISVASSSAPATITSAMTHRVMGTSPLLYRMIDYSKEQMCLEIEPIYSQMYNPDHVNENLILGGQNSLALNQQGGGDINPMWLNLMSNNSLANYESVVDFNPSMSQAGALLHYYDQYESFFVDVKTALLECTSQITLSETGGGDGLVAGILNAQQAFTQADWNYGKIGDKNHVIGLDNIEFRIGGVGGRHRDASKFNFDFAGFLLVEGPTGSGTKAESLFEPQIGTNHWGIGAGFEALFANQKDDLRFMIAANYRYLVGQWETRSFDLIGNGQWSRYLSVQDMYGLPTAPTTLGLPGINFFTQNAYIDGRSEVNSYLRLQKQFKICYLELSYNFLYVQGETIGTISNMTPGYGIYTLTGPAGGAGGVATSSTATISQDITTPNSILAPVAVTTADFNKLSATAGSYLSSNITARFEVECKKAIFGLGANIEIAQSNSALSTWAVWAQVGFLFDNVSHCPDSMHEHQSKHYDFDMIQANIKQQNNPISLEEEIAIIEEDSIKIVDESLYLAENALLISEINDNLDQDLKNMQDLKAAVIAQQTSAAATPAMQQAAPIAENPEVQVVPETAPVVLMPGPVMPEEAPAMFVENTTETPAMDTTAENQTVSLEDHPMVHQTENGIALHETKFMDDNDIIAKLNNIK